MAHTAALQGTAAASRPRIAVILKGYPRLSETFIAQELHGLEQRGFDLAFFSMRHPTDGKTHPIHAEIRAPVVYLPEYLHHEPIRVLRGLWHVMRRPTFKPALKAWLADLWRDPTPNRVRRFGQACVMAAELPDDIGHIYAHFIHTPGSVARYTHLLSERAWSCSAHAKDIWTSPDWDLKRKLQSCDWVATCTAVGHAHLRDLAAPRDNVHLVYHGLDLSRFPPAPKRSENEARDGSDRSAPIRLLSVGRAVEKKGFDTLLAALAQLPADLHWHYSHIGGGPLLKKLKAQADALGISSRIDWRGAQPQTDVLAAYRSHDLFVLPCRIAADGDRDGLPNVLVEAQSQAMACVSTPISAIPELIRDGETGRLVPPNAPEALANAIADLARDRSTRIALALAGMHRVRTAFDMHRGLDVLAALFPDHVRPVGHQGGQPDEALPASPDLAHRKEAEAAQSHDTHTPPAEAAAP